jgi:hypothetical protein
MRQQQQQRQQRQGRAPAPAAVLVGWAAAAPDHHAVPVTGTRTAATDATADDGTRALQPVVAPVERAAAWAAQQHGHTAVPVLRVPNAALVAVAPTLPAQLGMCIASHLRVLDLQGNRLTDLPAAVAAGLPQLVVLLLSHNALTCLPACVWDMPALVQLDASHNALMDLAVPQPAPASAMRMPAGVPGVLSVRPLAQLSLAHNQLHALPPSLAAAAPVLSHLVLRGNPLSMLPCELARLRFLQHIDVDACPLHTPATWVPPPAHPGQGVGALSLREQAARMLVRLGVPVDDLVGLPLDLHHWLHTAARCSECDGPYFGPAPPYVRVRWTLRGTHSVPWVHRLCADHWHDDVSALVFRFQPPPAPTAPPVMSATDRAAMIKRVRAVAAPPRSAEQPTVGNDPTLSARPAAVWPAWQRGQRRPTVGLSASAGTSAVGA